MGYVNGSYNITKRVDSSGNVSYIVNSATGKYAGKTGSEIIDNTVHSSKHGTSTIKGNYKDYVSQDLYNKLEQERIKQQKIEQERIKQERIKNTKEFIESYNESIRNMVFNRIKQNQKNQQQNFVDPPRPTQKQEKLNNEINKKLSIPAFIKQTTNLIGSNLKNIAWTTPKNAGENIRRGFSILARNDKKEIAENLKVALKNLEKGTDIATKPAQAVYSGAKILITDKEEAKKNLKTSLGLLSAGTVYAVTTPEGISTIATSLILAGAINGVKLIPKYTTQLKYKIGGKYVTPEEYFSKVTLET
ncbi:MAG: hypothetical protein PHN22_05140, partial [Candidatus ainarchaeum sp.]|nr:hypothetical protein [Candidatus ainarchaeum sp.]